MACCGNQFIAPRDLILDPSATVVLGLEGLEVSVQCSPKKVFMHFKGNRN